MTEPVEVPDEQTEAAPEEAPAEPSEPQEPSEEEQAEEETPEAPEAPEEPQEGPPAVQGLGERELEKMLKRVETANGRYSKQLGEIMGEEATVLEPCPRCASPFLGFIFPPTMKPVDQETKAAVLVSVGEEPAQAVRKDRYARTCEACDGMGATLSGSKTNRERTLTCYDCEGRGWTPVGPERAGAPSAPVVAATDNGVTQPVEQPPDHDPWGRGPSDPDYGRMPQYVGAR